MHLVATPKVMDPWAELPSVRAYLDRLPGGFDAHPECRAKGSLIKKMLQLKPDSVDIEDLPEPLRRYMELPPSSTEWIPEVHAGAIGIAYRDIGFESDGAYVQWLGGAFDRLFNSPLYRAAMMMANPMRLSKHAASRWNLIHRGSQRRMLQVEPWGSVGELDFPDYLYSGLFVTINATALQSVYRLTRARSALVTITELERNRLETIILYDVAKSPPPPEVLERVERARGERLRVA